MKFNHSKSFIDFQRDLEAYAESVGKTPNSVMQSVTGNYRRWGVIARKDVTFKADMDAAREYMKSNPPKGDDNDTE